MTFLPLLDSYRKGLHTGEFTLEMIGKFQSVRGSLVQAYHELVKCGKCTELKDLSSEEKQELWQEAKRISEVQEQNYLVEVCKALHGFGTFIELKEANLIIV